MADKSFFRATFDEFAKDGFIGNPNGEPAYAYMRVSSSGQAEEGRSGLPRQLEHIHEAAQKEGYKIPWNMVFADDDSGFAFEQRAELSRLRHEYQSQNRRANVVIIEYLDRLSRNADWHQGFLLDEIRKNGVVVIFWKSYNSRIERAVMGAISQDGMEQALQRMAEGTVLKAKSGRVTAKTPAYGYRFVDSAGNETGDKVKKETRYAINPDEAVIVRYIFENVAYRGVSLRALAYELEGLYPPPKKSAHWEQKLLSLIIRNPVYKGEFVANRKQEIKRIENGKRYRIERPKEEWIIVPVPAIVSPELWELANKMLDKNKQMGRRNARQPYLLTGLVKCSTCGYSIIGGRKKTTKPNGKTYHLSFYRCSSKHGRVKHIVEEINCDQSQISCNKFDDAVWRVLVDVLLEPQILIDVLDRQYAGEQNTLLNEQTSYLESEIVKIARDDERLYRAYMADAFDELEYKERREELKHREQILRAELDKLTPQIMTIEQYEDKKSSILTLCQNARERGVALDAPFEVRQMVIKTLVDRIISNPNEGWFQLEGVINGRFPIVESIPMGRDTHNISHLSLELILAY